MATNPFERSKADREPKSMKEGTKREEKFDAKQMKAVAGPKGFAAKVSKPKPFAKGGAVKKAGRGC